MRTIAVFLWMLAVPAAAPAQAVARPEILVIGTYHMASPGRDIHNLQTDDILSPRRQQEVAQLVEVLRRFRPTKIAVESYVRGERVKQQYADYLAGSYTLTRNEVDQVGFRLARELGHATIHPVDEDGDFPYLRVVNYARANGLQASLDSLQALTGARVREVGEFLGTHSVLEALEHINSDEMVARDVASYYALLRFGEPFEYAGPDLLASWFQRNIRIYASIRALATSPDNRILVIYGYGHLGWLRQNAASDASVQLRTLADLTGRR